MAEDDVPGTDLPKAPSDRSNPRARARKSEPARRQDERSITGLPPRQGNGKARRGGAISALPPVLRRGARTCLLPPLTSPPTEPTRRWALGRVAAGRLRMYGSVGTSPSLPEEADRRNTLMQQWTTTRTQNRPQGCNGSTPSCARSTIRACSCRCPPRRRRARASMCARSTFVGRKTTITYKRGAVWRKERRVCTTASV